LRRSRAGYSSRLSIARGGGIKAAGSSPAVFFVLAKKPAPFSQQCKNRLDCGEKLQHHGDYRWHTGCGRWGANKEVTMEEMPEILALFSTKADLGGISPIERLLNEFEAHEVKEEKSIDDYKRLLKVMPNPMTKFLLQLVISDEEKHRAMIHAMVATLKGSLTWTKPEGSLEGGIDLAEANGELRSVTDAFIELEKEGIRECKTLMKDSSGYYHGVFKVLLDSMVRDSEKHVELLEFVKEQIG
jgi:rubrerythrin